MRVGSKLMGFKEFLASPDFARIRESKSPLTVRGPTGRGPATGVGYRNAGDALGAVQYGQERGYHEEQKKRVEPWSQPLPAPRASVPSTGKLATSADTIESLERLQRLREAGALSAEEFEAEKRRVLGG